MLFRIFLFTLALFVNTRTDWVLAVSSCEHSNRSPYSCLYIASYLVSWDGYRTRIESDTWYVQYDIESFISTRYYFDIRYQVSYRITNILRRTSYWFHWVEKQFNVKTTQQLQNEKKRQPISYLLWYDTLKLFVNQYVPGINQGMPWGSKRWKGKTPSTRYVQVRWFIRGTRYRSISI